MGVNIPTNPLEVNSNLWSNKPPKACNGITTVLKDPQLILIDLDGTLVDSVPDLTWAVDRTMEALGQPTHGEDKVRDWVGNGIERLVKRALTDDLWAEPEQAEYDRAYPVFFDFYHQANGRYSRLFPGVDEGLQALSNAGYTLACVTNKAEAFTLPLLESLGIREFFKLVVSGDTLAQKKPEPEPLWHAADQLGVARERALMVGDSAHDVEAARRAGFQVACVPYGYNHGNDIREARPDLMIDSLSDLARRLQEAA